MTASSGTRRMLRRMLVGSAGCALVAAVFAGSADVCLAASFNVVDFGADGHDLLDDSEAIQQALNKSRGATGETEVYVPNGTYHINQPLFIFSNTSLRLDSGATIVKDSSDYTVMLAGRHLNDDGTPCYGTATCGHGGYSQLSNIKISGGVWDAGSNSDENNSVFYLLHGSDIEIRDTTIRHSSLHMVNLSAGRNLLVENVVFADAWDRENPDDYVTVEALHLDAATDEGEPGGFPVDGTPCTNVSVVGCMFTNVFAGVGTHHVVSGSTFGNLIVSNCIFTKLKSYAVHAYGMTDCELLDNRVEDCAGFLRSNSSECRVSGNQVLAMLESAFYDNESRIAVSNNVVDGCGVTGGVTAHGIYAVGGSSIQMVDNEIRNANGCGIRADSGSSVVSSGNTITSPTIHGFSFTGGSSLLSESDTVSSSGGSGFVVSGGGAVSIAGAEVDSPSAVGIQLDDIESGEIRADAISFAGSHGIVLNGCRSSTVCDNVISDSGGNGIVVIGSSVQMADNEIRNANGCGIRADSGSSVVSSGNTIVSPTSHGFGFTGGSSLQSEADTVSSAGGSGFVVAGGGVVSIAGAEVASPSSVGIQFDDVEFGEISADAISAAGSHGIVLNGCQSSMVQDNVISGSGGHGIIVVGGSANLQRNAISASSGNGVSTESQAQLVAAGNTISGGQYGFCVKSGCSLFANGNTISGALLSAVYAVGASAVTCTGNEITMPGNCGFYMHQTVGAAIKGNSVQGSGWPSVWIRESPVCEVSGNEIADSAQEGIYCTGSAQCVVTSNLVTGAAKIGIRVDGTDNNRASAKIFDNDVTSASTIGDIRVCSEASGYEVAGNVCRGAGFTMEYAVADVTEYHPADARITSVELMNVDAAEVKWENQAGVTGYFVEYSPSADFPEGATGRSENIVDGSGRCGISGLAASAMWYVRVRTYHAYFGALYESLGDPAFCETVSMSDVPEVSCHSITFDANGGEGGWSRQLAWGEKLDPPLPQREGYDFVGWFPEVPERAGAVDVTYTAQWKTIDGSGQGSDVQQQVYTVTFDANGGEGGWSRQLAFGDELDPPEPQREGCDFVGWFPEVPERAGAVDVTYTAQWEVNQYALTFDANGGEGGVAVTQDYGAELAAPTVTREGYTFTGWSPEVPSTVPATNAVYTAQWEVNRYALAFDANGGDGGVAVTQDYGTELAAPTVTRTGYTFVGWSPEVPSTVPAVAATYVAQWAKTQCTVTFGANGGTGGDNCVTVTYGKPMPTPRTAPTLSGWTFAGYWDSVALDEKGNPKGKQYYDANMKSVRNWDKNSAAPLWAKWTNRVSFGKNGGTGGDNYVTCTRGQPMPKRTMPTKSGYVFDGYWTTTGAGGVKYYNADGTSAHTWDKGGSVTLWAKWVPARYKVTFGKNGGSGGDDFVTATYAAAMPTPRTAPKKAGYIFEGYWNTAGANGICYYDANMKSVRTWDKAGNVILWAKWVPARYKVTFGKNGGTGGDDFVTATYAAAMPTPRTAPKRTGWTFAGYWDTLAQDANGHPKGKQYYDANMMSVRNWDKAAAATLWAKWTVRVKLGKNGGTGGDDFVTVTYNQPFPKRTMPKRNGYVFVGYFVSSSKMTGQCYNMDGTGTSSMKWSNGGSPTVWALWTQISSCVEFLPPSAAPYASAAPAGIPAGIYSGVLADGKGTFCLLLDEAKEGVARTAFLYLASEGGVFAAECSAEDADGVLLLATEDGQLYVFDPVAGTLADAAVFSKDGV